VATAAILPVKRFDAAKQRLGETLGARTRATLAAAMFADVLAQVGQARAVDSILVVSSEPAIKALVEDTTATLLPDAAEKGQSQAALAGMARAAARGCDRALLVPGDCPLIDPAELDALAAVARGLDVAIVPDRHGTGTNALVLDPTGSFEPRFGPGSRARHVEQAEGKGLTYTIEEVPSLGLDVDTGDDLSELVRVLDGTRGRAPRTRGVVSQIGRARTVAA
jgi:2-phospho-L-lactate/phosphoenolpyruvate guanylyltransferase